MIRLYIGHVQAIDENQIIDFTLDDIYTDTSIMPRAIPLCRVSRVAQIDDEVMIIQPNDQIELYYYIQSREDSDYVSLEYNEAKIKIDVDGNIEITTAKDSGNLNVTTYGTGTVNIDTTNADTGNFNISTKGNINVDSAKNINLTSDSKITIDAPTTKIDGTKITINGMSTVGFLKYQLLTPPHPHILMPTSSASCTGLTISG